MPLSTLRFDIGPDDVGRRVDRILRILLPSAPLSFIQKLLRDGDARLSGRKADGSDRASPGDWLEVRLSEELAASVRVKSGGARGGAHVASRAGEGTAPEAARGLSARFRTLILAETDDLVVANKPVGMLTHGEGGLDRLAAAYLAGKASASLSFAPAPLHRLDRNTSGAVVISASLAGARAFSEALRAGHMLKFYLALLEGELRRPETWVDLLARDEEAGVSRADDGGREASLDMTPLASGSGLTLAGIRLGSGLTHQIRAQAALHGHPLAGDAKYGGARRRNAGYLLHCARLGFPEELLGMAPPIVDAPPPEGAASLLVELFGPGCLSTDAWPRARA